MTINRFPPYYDLCLRCREKGLDNVADFIHELYAERELLRESLRLERQLRDDALRAFNEARAALKEGE